MLVREIDAAAARTTGVRPETRPSQTLGRITEPFPSATGELRRVATGSVGTGPGSGPYMSQRHTLPTRRGNYRTGFATTVALTTMVLTR